MGPYDNIYGGMGVMNQAVNAGYELIPRMLAMRAQNRQMDMENAYKIAAMQQQADQFRQEQALRQQQFGLSKEAQDAKLREQADAEALARQIGQNVYVGSTAARSLPELGDGAQGPVLPPDHYARFRSMVSEGLARAGGAGFSQLYQNRQYSPTMITEDPYGNQAPPMVVPVNGATLLNNGGSSYSVFGSNEKTFDAPGAKAAIEVLNTPMGRRDAAINAGAKQALAAAMGHTNTNPSSVTLSPPGYSAPAPFTVSPTPMLGGTQQPAHPVLNDIKLVKDYFHKQNAQMSPQDAKKLANELAKRYSLNPATVLEMINQN